MLIVKEIFNELVKSGGLRGLSQKRKQGLRKRTAIRDQVSEKNGDQGFILRQSASSYVTNTV